LDALCVEVLIPEGVIKSTSEKISILTSFATFIFAERADLSIAGAKREKAPFSAF